MKFEEIAAAFFKGRKIKIRGKSGYYYVKDNRVYNHNDVLMHSILPELLFDEVEFYSSEDGFSFGEWINIREVLPAKHQYVLVYRPSNNCIKIKWVFSDQKKELLSSRSRFYGVTHWMPLPEIPIK